MATENLPQQKNHPVWEVYDLLRLARLNVKYYTHQLQRIETASRSIDILIAIGAPVSAAAGFWFFKTDTGANIWKTFSAITAVLAMTKPFLRYSDKIKKIEQALTGYRGLDFDMTQLANDVRNEQTYSKPHQKLFKSAQSKLKELVVHPPNIPQNGKLIEAFSAQVNAQLPAANFYIPEK